MKLLDPGLLTILLKTFWQGGDHEKDSIKNLLQRRSFTNLFQSSYQISHRSQLENQQGSDDADVPESEFMKSFKVATFEFTAGNQKKEAADNATKPHFWEDVLQMEHLELEAAEQDRLGKGKRTRKVVSNLPFLPPI